ncbi:conserved hypothetical protein [Ricinus communis]|uniref:Uncharacterized protein n=1 Tax=Ricinus communis TaxID=3988 RepID=B9SE27_RICCO|nr:conserved hypothetical protein [Ricinus communis]
MVLGSSSGMILEPIKNPSWKSFLKFLSLIVMRRLVLKLTRFGGQEIGTFQTHLMTQQTIFGSSISGKISYCTVMWRNL